MNIPRTLLASTLMALAATGVMAQPLTITSQAENFAITYHDDSANIVDGGNVAIIGGGQEADYMHAAGSPSQRGKVARFVGQGENGAIAYSPAGSNSWMMGQLVR